MSQISRRSLTNRLEALRADVTLDDSFADDLAVRLQSLAIAASFEVDAKKGRWRRKFVAVIGSVGVIGWIGVTGAAASVGLATTGNLPAPVQDVVSTVFEVVGIDIPTSGENDQAPVDEPTTIDIDEEPADSSTGEEDSSTEETTIPVAVSIAPETSIPSDIDDDGLVEESPVASTRPGNSGNTPAVTAPGQVGNPGNSGNTPAVTAPGQSGNNPSVTAPGQSGNNPSVTAPGQSGNNPSVTAPGQSGNAGNSSDAGTPSESPSATAPGRVGGSLGTTGNGNSNNNGRGNRP